MGTQPHTHGHIDSDVFSPEQEDTEPWQVLWAVPSLKTWAIPPEPLHGTMASHSVSPHGVPREITLPCSKEDAHRGHLWSRACQGETGQNVSIESLIVPVVNLGSLAQ